MVRDVAPAIGTALGGPAAGIGVKFLADKLLGKPGASPAEVAAALQDMPANLQVELKKLDLEFKAHAADVGLDLEKLEVQRQQIAAQDRDSARTMQIQTRSWMPGVLSGVAVIGFLGSLGVAFFIDLPDKRMNLVMFLLGVLTALVKDVYAFTFGTNADSQRKTEMLHQQFMETP